MSDALENAALAFDADMGNSSPAKSSASANSEKAKPEPLFANPGEFLDGSDDTAGDDDEPDEDEDQRPARKPRKEDEDDDSSDEDDGDEGPEAEDDLTDEEREALKAAKEEDDDSDIDLDQKVAVMVDGQETEVSLREALNGYIRTDTFHKRMNEVDGARKIIAAEAQKVVDDRERAIAILAEAEEVLQSLMPKEPDWDALYAADPLAARKLQKQYDEYKAKVDEIKGKRSGIVKEATEKQQKEKLAFAQAEFPKFAKYAGFKTQDDVKKDTASMRKTALAVGFSEEELSDVLDSRMLIVLHKASKYDRMMANRPKAVKKVTKPVGPGAGSKSTAHKGIIRAQEKLTRTGSIEDAASVFAQMIK